MHAAARRPAAFQSGHAAPVSVICQGYIAKAACFCGPSCEVLEGKGELEEQNGEPLPDREAMSLIVPHAGADGIATIAPN